MEVKRNLLIFWLQNKIRFSLQARCLHRQLVQLPPCGDWPIRSSDTMTVITMVYVISVRLYFLRIAFWVEAIKQWKEKDITFF